MGAPPDQWRGCVTTGSCARSWLVTTPSPRPRSGMPCAPSTTKSSCASLPPAYHPPPDQPEQALKAEKAAATTKTIVKVLVTKRR